MSISVLRTSDARWDGEVVATIETDRDTDHAAVETALNSFALNWRAVSRP
ncbi:hypothetical protein [Nocardia sp. MDA0666]|nr:hypothetical protein [Nocardia sp. MDA0666]